MDTSGLKIQLQKTEITLQTALHQDIPQHSDLLVQILVGYKIVKQNLASHKSGDGTASWEVIFSWDIPQDVLLFTIAVFSEIRPRVYRILGTIETRREMTETLTERPLPISKIDADGPSLIVNTAYLLSQEWPVSSSLLSQAEPNIPAQYPKHPDMKSIDEMIGRKVDMLDILTMHTAILLSPLEKVQKANLLHRLGDACSQHHQSRNVDNLQRAASIYEDALRQVGDNIPVSWWNDLGICLLHCFEQLDTVVDLTKSIRAFEESTAQDHADKTAYLSNLGHALQARFERLGDIGDLNRAIESRNIAISLTPDDFPNKASQLHNLGISLHRRFERLGDLADLDKAIEIKVHIASLTPDEHPSKPIRLCNLGNSLQARFQHIGVITDLNKAIEAHKLAVSLASDVDPNKAALFTNLGNSLEARFARLGDLADLSKAVEAQENAVSLTPQHHPNKAARLSNLGYAFQTRFMRLGSLIDLNNAINAHTSAVGLTPDNHPNKPGQLNNLGTSLVTRFEHLNDLADLNKAIEVQGYAVSQMPDGHLDKADYLNSLGVSLMRRFEHFGDLADLNHAIKLEDHAVSLTPDVYPKKSARLSFLGTCLHLRFERLRNLTDLDRAITTHGQAVSLSPEDHPNKAGQLSSLGNSLQERFGHLGNITDLNKAVEVKEKAVSLLPEDHPLKPALLGNLGFALHTRFQRLIDPADIDGAIQVHHSAVLLTSENHPDKVTHLVNLGDSLRLRFEHGNNPEDLHGALSSYSSAAQAASGPVHIMLLAGTKWMSMATLQHSDQAISACTVVMKLLPHIVWLGSALPDRHHRIADVGRATREAVGIVTANGQHNTALEWLEHGVSIVWNQLLQLRSPLDELEDVHPDLAADLRSISITLEGSSSRRQSDTLQKTMTMSEIDYHKAAHERDMLLTQIRQMSRFERFLLPRTLDQLLPAANQGPVVMLNADKSRCDALIICLHDPNVLHVHLKDITYDQVSAMQECMHKVRTKDDFSTNDLPRLKEIRLGESDTQKVDREYVLARVLEKLWNSVVKPVLDALQIMNPMASASNTRRLWWCPAGPFAFLPLHAAGIYSEDSETKVSDYVISSYTPNLAMLLRKPDSETLTKRQLLTVALPYESGLPGTKNEVESIAKQAKNFDVVPLFGLVAAANDVATAMKTSNWVHFACHGKQSWPEPTESCLLLSGHSKLTISEIIKLSLKNAELAFLSACETATGDQGLQDEAVHLAAGMLLAGYRGVIATMWAINDKFTVDIAEETYRLLFKEYGADSTRAAEALHFAIKKVREEKKAKGKKAPLFYWVPFIHLGH